MTSVEDVIDTTSSPDGTDNATDSGDAGRASLSDRVRATPNVGEVKLQREDIRTMATVFGLIIG